LEVIVGILVAFVDSWADTVVMGLDLDFVSRALVADIQEVALVLDSAQLLGPVVG
jgi:hypothetical protein